MRKGIKGRKRLRNREEKKGPQQRRELETEGRERVEGKGVDGWGRKEKQREKKRARKGDG